MMHNRFANPAAFLSAALAIAAARNIEAQPLQESNFGAEAQAAIASSAQPLSAQERTVVRPKASPDTLYFAPDSGWQTCDRALQSTSGPVERLSRVAYQKFYWDQIEIAPGRYDFSLIDAAVQDAHSKGQRLDLRPVMPYAPEEGPPQFLKAAGIKGDTVIYDDGDSRQQFWAVDFNDPAIRAIYINLIKALGARYDSDARIGMVDISIFGLWGEGHVGEVSLASDAPGKPAQQAFASKYALSAQARKELVDAYFDAFPNKQKLAQITDVETLKYATSRGAGIRMDCFGGYYMEHSVYLQNLKAAGATEVWKTAPVVAEICGTLASWAGNWGSGERQYNDTVVQQILDRGSDVYHLTAINAKNGDKGQIPEKLAAPFQRFLAKIGYRIGLDEVSFPSALHPGQTFELRVEAVNSGVAPCYNKNYVWALQFQDQTGRVLSTIMTDRSIAGVLPGQFKFEERIAPTDIPSGASTVALGIVDKSQPNAGPVVRMAIANEKSGWYPLGTFEKK